MPFRKIPIRFDAESLSLCFSKETQNVLLDALKEMYLKSAKTNKKYLGKQSMILGRL